MEKIGAGTLGQYLWSRQKERSGVRARGKVAGTKVTYDFYPTRRLVEDEFDAIWAKQSPHHPSMTAEAREAIHDAIFFQRPLKKPPVGKCTLKPAGVPFEQDPEGYRVAWAHPLAQRFRILQEVRNLAVGPVGYSPRKLAKEEGDAIVLALLQSNKVSFDKMRGILKLPADQRFNLESERRAELKGDETAERLSHKTRFGKAWRGFSLDRQAAIVDRLMNEEDETKLVAWLRRECDLDVETAARIADTPLPEGYARLGLRAIRKLFPLMNDKGLNYPDAAREAGYDHANAPTGEILDRLPYYGRWLPNAVVGSGDPRDVKEKRFGRFPNPTVHIGLGQLRRLVNTLIEELGAPEEIVVEFTRSLKLSPEEKRQVQTEQRRNQEKNERRVAEIKRLPGYRDYDPTPRDLLKMRLWEELNPRDPLDRKFPYTGDNISLAQLMSAEVDIDHLIPYTVGLDDSPANKIICFREANRHKRKRTPFEAFGSSPAIGTVTYNWDEISQRAANLPRNKNWRFGPDALDRYKEMGGFLARQLMETGWLARVARQYLGAVCDPYSIWVIPGRLTAMIRARWGLNSLLPDHNYPGVQERDETFRAATDDLEFSGIKNRADHRHHAIDAFVAALTDRSLLQRIASRYDEEREKVDIPEPWEGLRDELKARLDAMVVSHKPDHGKGGRLHEDTAYGLVKEPEKEAGNLVRRKDLASLTENEIELTRDIRLRERVRDHVYAARAAGMDLKGALADFVKSSEGDPHTRHGVHRIRLLKVEKPEYLVPVAGADGTLYKAYSAGENFCVEIYDAGDGRWQGEAIRRFDANQPGYRPRWQHEFPDARLIMRVHKGDLLQLDDGTGPKIWVVYRLDASAGRFKLAPHNETGNLDRRHATDTAIDPFRWLMASYGTLKRMNAGRVRVDEIGRVWPITPDDARKTK
nr:type II CRISPR RNA-guided endonuclease Cas9 [Bosea sp. 117]